MIPIPMSDAISWADYEFPEWVPDAVRDEIRRFWSEKWGRSPRSWHESARGEYNHQPPIGSVVEAQSLTQSGLPFLVGRWVPTWNNIGRVVMDDGTYKCSSTCGIRIISETVMDASQ